MVILGKAISPTNTDADATMTNVNENATNNFSY